MHTRHPAEPPGSAEAQTWPEGQVWDQIWPFWPDLARRPSGRLGPYAESARNR
eukprot:NODE_8505_length_514_cov_7.468817_g7443_i0.p3 GENE.NODE_8505_length_514_cov_7.468817_g7443_i0~~NODE_8505_length_514_cov_7.468817_g7443_i0.p3  ORF type:complete len:53 (-),score=0.78 NODE_8505_length_514_cov_7.468817_g7443_i0:82-240(-)